MHAAGWENASLSTPPQNGPMQLVEPGVNLGLGSRKDFPGAV